MPYGSPFTQVKIRHYNYGNTYLVRKEEALDQDAGNQAIDDKGKENNEDVAEGALALGFFSHGSQPSRGSASFAVCPEEPVRRPAWDRRNDTRVFG